MAERFKSLQIIDHYLGSLACQNITPGLPDGHCSYKSMNFNALHFGKRSVGRLPDAFAWLRITL